MARHKVILDCDTGRDDAIALALALASPNEIDLLGITTLAGNAPLHLTQRNTRFVCELCGHPEVKVYAGASRPLLVPLLTAEYAHGATGLEGIEVQEPTAPLQSLYAVTFIIETLRQAEDNSITLVPTGPLTNIALVIIQAPELLPKIKQIVLMGGAHREAGNITPSAEFNIFVDPHAAHVVFTCGRPLVVLSLDVTHRVLATPAHAARLAQGGKAAQTLAPLFRQMPAANKERHGIDVSAQHDACTIAYLIKPSLFETRDVFAEIEIQPGANFGRTVVDYWHRLGKKPNVAWAHQVKGAEVLDLIVERISGL